MEVPPAFAVSTVAREGDAGAAWIDALPGVVDELCDAWGLLVDGPPMHGYVALVVPVAQGRERLVLKVSWLDRSSEHEALTLRAWDGRGAVRLLDASERHGAMLLERLDSDHTLEHADPEEAVRVAGTLLRRLSIPAPSELRTVAEELAHIREWLASTWSRVGRPFSRALLDEALEATAMPTESSEPLVVNQDLHYGNVLGGAREPWLVIDPKALAGDPEFGVAQLLWTRFDDLHTRADLERRMAILVETAELAPDLAAGLSLVRVVEYWLWALDLGFTEDLHRCRTLADWLAPQFAHRG